MHRSGGSGRPIVAWLVVVVIVTGTVVPANALGPSWDWWAFLSWLARIVSLQQAAPTESSATSIVPAATTTTSTATATTTTAAPVAAPVSPPTTATSTTATPTTSTTTRPPAPSGSAAPVGSTLCSKGPRPPADHYLKARVDGLPTLANTWVQTVAEGGKTLRLMTQPWYFGYPVNLIPNNYSMTQVYMFTWSYISDSVPFPTPQFLRYQGWPLGPMYDHYQLSVTADCRTYELIGTNNLFNIYDGTLPGPWKAEGGLMWDADYTPRANSMGGPMGVTASAEPLTPQVIRVAELAAGSVDHVMHFSNPKCRGGAITLGQAYVWPARASDCIKEPADPSMPPYGAWFRLRADYPAPADPGAAAVVTALKTHGMILGDGPTLGIATEPGVPAATTAAVDSIPMADFEAVDTSSLRANPSAGIASADYWKIK